MESVSCGAYTIIRGQTMFSGENDVFKFHFGCSENNLQTCCNNRGADLFSSFIAGSCQCQTGKSTFLLHIGTCVRNELMRNSSFMDFGEDGKNVY